MATIEDLANEQALAVVLKYHLKDDLFKSKVKNVLHTFKSTIETLPSIKGKSFSSEFLRCSFGNLTTCLASLKSLNPPGKICLIGSHILGIQTGHLPNADLYLEAPEGLFGKEDLYDAKYHKKRVVYLCYIAEGIKKNFQEYSISFSQTNTLRPMLQISIDDSFTICVHLGIKSCDTFSLDHFDYNSKYLSESFFNSQLSVPHVPSPQYLDTIAQDFLFLDHLSFIHGNLKEVKNLQSACILFKVWLEKREIQMNFVFTMLVALLSQRGFIQRDWSTHKIFVEILKFISKNSTGYFSADLVDSSSRFGEGAVFVDCTGRVNLLNQIDQSLLSYVSQEAKQTLGLLAVYSVYPEKAFAQIFSPTNPPMFDLVVEISCSDGGILKESLFNSKRFLAMLGASGDRLKTILFWIPWMLNKALSSKISCMRCEIVTEQQIMIRLRYSDESTANNPVLKGPLTEDKVQATFFQALWGSLAELKRYSNGSIHEVVNCPADEKFPVYFLASHLLQRHASLSKNQIQLHSQYDPFHVSLPVSVRIPADVKEAFGQLHQLLKDVPELVSIIDNLIPFSACFRGTSLQIPQQTKVKRRKEGQSMPNSMLPITIGIQFQQTISLQDQVANEDDDICISISYCNLFKLYQYFQSTNYYCSISSDPFLDVEYLGFLFRIIPVSNDSSWSGFYAYKTVTLTAAHFITNPLFSQLSVIFKQWLDCNLLLQYFLNDPLEICPELIVCKFIFDRYSSIHHFSLARLTWEFFQSLPQLLTDNNLIEHDSFCLLQRDYTTESGWISSIAQPISKISSYLNSHLPNQLVRRRILHLASRISNSNLFVPILGDFDLVMEKVSLESTIISFPVIGRINIHEEAIEIVKKEFKDCLFFTSSTHLGIVLTNKNSSTDTRQQIINRLALFYRPIRK